MDEKIKKFVGKKIMFLFDTNFYRRLIDMDGEDDRNLKTYILFIEMRKKEVEKGCNIVRSLTAAQELIAHLIEGDDSFKTCKEALRFQEWHSQNEQGMLNSPSIDFLLPYFFYKDGGGDSMLHNEINYTEWLKYVIKKIICNQEDSTTKIEVEKINKNFKSYKLEFYDLIKSLISQPKNERKCWDFFSTEGSLDTVIENKDYLKFMVEYFRKRTEFLSGNESSISESRIIEFSNIFKEALLHFRYVFEVLEKDGKSLEDIESKTKKWNFVNDFQIVFEWCFLKYFNKEKEVEIILVTEDGSRNFKAPIRSNGTPKSMHEIHDNVWHAWQYFEFIGFNVDKASPKKKIIKSENGFIVDGISKIPYKE